MSRTPSSKQQKQSYCGHWPDDLQSHPGNFVGQVFSRAPERVFTSEKAMSSDGRNIQHLEVCSSLRPRAAITDTDKEPLKRHI